MSQLSVKGLSYTYSDGVPALKGLDFQLETGSRTALVGPNGAGKTSLLLAIAGLLQTQGEILINHAPLTAKNADSLREHMSFVFQNPDEMLFMPTVIEDVCFGLDTLGLDDKMALERGQAALSQVSLEGYEQRSAHHLSYGERRKVCIATALARRSDITLFDEPSRELDPYGRRNFIDLFHKMTGTMILATHDLELVLETCTQMILLDEGQIIKMGKPDEILGDVQLMESHKLEVPHSLTRHPHSH
ncbi:MAG: energy-coupling factor ABC transporter ATP-binding protein [Candidatus Marinimicrobia bacterium]|nr:energy-coupling factor ABC transporter ATP-binding protein [Candidatus Neomarinimicrobiota bacterium]MCF7921106.1 energy-coupling factor ABC transporter ATP-binding protein [Candidatus Neomarinimicrobiota bacterium]